MMFSVMLTDAQDCNAGFPIRYRFDGKLFILSRLQAKSKVQKDMLVELIYADDMAKNAKTEKSKKISNDQELIQSDPISCPQNQKGK